MRLSMELQYRDDVPYAGVGLINNKAICTHVFTSGEVSALLLPTHSTPPAVEDGIYCDDTTLRFTKFAVKPLAGSTVDGQLFIKASQFAPVSGAPNLNALPSSSGVTWPAWMLDFAGTEIVSTVIQAPAGVDQVLRARLVRQPQQQRRAVRCTGRVPQLPREVPRRHDGLW